MSLYQEQDESDSYATQWPRGGVIIQVNLYAVSSSTLVSPLFTVRIELTEPDPIHVTLQGHFKNTKKEHC